MVGFCFGSPSWTRTNDTAVNSRVLYRLSYGGILKPTKQSLIGYLCRHRPIFPGRFQPSIFGTNELNYRVRNGNGCTLITINTYYFGLHSCTLKTEQRWTRQKHFSEFTQIKFRSSPRPISISPLHTLLYFHSWPINHIVYVGSYFRRMGNLILRGVSRLDAFSVYLVQT